MQNHCTRVDKEGCANYLCRAAAWPQLGLVEADCEHYEIGKPSWNRVVCFWRSQVGNWCSSQQAKLVADANYRQRKWESPDESNVIITNKVEL